MTCTLSTRRCASAPMTFSGVVSGTETPTALIFPWLEQLKENLPPRMVNQLFSQMAADLVDEYAQTANLNGLSIEQRLELVNDLLQEEGFDLEWEKKDNQYFIREINCPYLHVGQTHPEVCVIDQTLISTVLDLPTEKIKCILDGDKQCTYVVPDMASITPSEEYS